ncbi:PAAR domain-containing protein [Burkholderia cepacia]|uniref:PAAR domain-containing protein n=1 Tax=Burkholderia cepacia TaxID=292 RepID=UPI002FE0D357
MVQLGHRCGTRRALAHVARDVGCCADNSKCLTFIATVSGHARFDGQVAACDGDLLACGARLIASQDQTGG